MSYIEEQNSIQDSEPVELFTFKLGVYVWYYTNDVQHLEDDGHTYRKMMISHSRISQSEEINRADLTISAPNFFTPASKLKNSPTSVAMTVTIQRYHRQDGVAEKITIWKGTVKAISWGQVESQLTCSPIYASVTRASLKRNYGYLCPHLLYGSACQVAKPTYLQTAAVVTVDPTGLLVSITGAAASAVDHYYQGGYLQFTTIDTNIERRMIVGNSQAGGAHTLTLASPSEYLEVGTALELYPGCKKTLEVCKEKFNNVVNYGGFPYTPKSSPFGGKTIFDSADED